MKLSMAQRWLTVGAVLAGIVAVAWWALPGAQSKVEPGDPAPNFTLPDLKGTMHSLPKGEVILLNFWATWCPPCRQEMPSMAALSERMADRGLRVIAVSVDRDYSSLKGFVQENQIPFQVLWDRDNRVSARYGVFRYPESFLIDQNGVVQEHIVGAVNWTGQKMLSHIEALLRGAPLNE